MLQRCKSTPSLLTGVSCDLESCFSSWCRGGKHFQIEISFINVNVSYKRVTSTPVFRASPVSAFPKNSQLKIILMLKRHIWGEGHIALPFMTKRDPLICCLPCSYWQTLTNGKCQRKRWNTSHSPTPGILRRKCLRDPRNFMNFSIRDGLLDS